jgi:hypothetical protein
MIILKRVMIQLVPDSTGTAYSSTQVSYEVGTTDSPTLTTMRLTQCPLSVPDQANAQTVFNDVVAWVKAQEGIS